jgi:hypothetical protein
VIWVVLFRVNVAETPLKATAEAPAKFVPVMTTEVPIGPDTGEKPVIVIVAPVPTVKSVELEVVPPGVVTAIFPVVAPEGTVAVILVVEFSVKVAVTPLKVTAEALLKVLPLMTTLVPTGPEPGEKLVMVGGTRNEAVLDAAPAALVTLILPVVAVEGTVAVIWVGESIVKVAPAALNATALDVSKLVPVMTTEVPEMPLPGVKPVTVGGTATTKLVALVAVPPGAVSVIFPVVVPAETVAVTWVEETTVNDAALPLNFTEVVPVNPVPVMVTLALMGPAVGVKPVMLTAEIVKLAVLVPVPDGVVTVILPVVAPDGTVAVIWVSELTVNAVAGVPLNATAVAPVNPLPVTTTLEPEGPEVGEKLVIVGPAIGTYWAETLWSAGVCAGSEVDRSARYWR